MLKRFLRELGFTENEIALYLCLIRSGKSPASTLSKRTGVHRVTVYSALERLRARGLVGHEFMGKTRWFFALDLAQIIDCFYKDIASIKANIAKAESFIHALETTQAS